MMKWVAGLFAVFGLAVVVAAIAAPFGTYDCEGERKRLVYVGERLTSATDGAKMFATLGHPEIALARAAEIKPQLDAAQRDFETWKRRCQ
jgi:hypothetical protein